MDQTDKIDFGDLQKQERFKKLERSLRVTRLKHVTNCQLKSIPWPSCSSINGEQSDFNSTLSTLQFSKTGSEILTSSKNLKDLLRRPFHSPMATSSVKKYSESDQSPDDRRMMPPPPSNFEMIRQSSKRSSDSEQMRRQNTNISEVLVHKEDNPELNSSIERNSVEGTGNPKDSQKGKPIDRHFYRWKVHLNDKGDLLIKGSLNNEIWTRSKPVIKMLTSTKLESKYQNIYHLHGNIIDEKNELPKYIYSKFYNGFPDDWKNVHQIWKNYVAQGNKENFRWPTDVSHSDDDLNSEITDDIHLHKTSDTKFQDFSFMEKSTPQRSSGYSSDIQQERIETLKNVENWKNDPVRSNSAENLDQLSEKENRTMFDVTNDRSCNGTLYVALNYAHSLKDFIFEDKLRTITQNLMHEKCPKEYLELVDKTIKNLYHLISYKCGESNEEAFKNPKTELENQSPFPESIRKCSTPLSYESASNMEIVRQKSKVIQKKVDSNTENNEKVKLRKEESKIVPVVTKPKETQPITNSDDSESEVYFGVAKMPSEKILQSNAHHRRFRKTKRTGKRREQFSSKERKNLNYDSCVSLVEDDGLNNCMDNDNRVRTEVKNVKGNFAGSNVDYKERNSAPLREEHPALGMLRKPEFDANKSPIETFVVTSQNKPRVINIEKVDLISNSNRPSKNQLDLKEGKPSGSKMNEDLSLDERHSENMQENPNNDSFGSKKNPKILESWIPLVRFDGKNCHLVFEGTILNAVGRPMKKKFTTNPVVRRISSTIIETADQQFYKLTGDLNMNKNVIPKALLAQCRNGCPPNIESFCASWLKLKGENVAVERPQKTFIDQKNIPQTSRGRTVLPPLNFWSDERIIKKDGETVYKSGDPKEKFITSIIESPEKNRSSRNSHLYGLRKRQKMESNGENYSNEVKKFRAYESKQLPKSRNTASAIQCSYKKKNHDTDVTLSDDQQSIV